jgi:fumarate reductase flavoprotein subunit
VEFLQGETKSFFSSQALKEAAAMVQGRIDALVSRSRGNENCFVLRDAMQDAMMEHVGIFRNGKDLAAGVEKLQKLLERSERIGLQSGNTGFSPELSMALRVPGMIKLALCTAYGALQRTESRGAHAREDFPERNDRDWLNRTLATWKEGESLPVLAYEEASPWFEIPPGERGYGGGKIISADIPQEKIKPFGSEGKGA